MKIAISVPHIVPFFIEPSRRKEEEAMSITGFSNIKSSEYVILHDLYSRFSDNFSFFYPFQFMHRRDDTQISTANSISDLKLIVIFPRRPKTDFPGSELSIVTFQSSIFDQTNEFYKMGIPVISGTPIGTGIDAIGFGSRCEWFSICSGYPKEKLAYYFQRNEIDTTNLSDYVRHLNDIKLLSLLSQAPTYSWKDVLRTLESWYLTYYNHYREHRSRNLFNTYSGIKPVFLTYKL